MRTDIQERTAEKMLWWKDSAELFATQISQPDFDGTALRELRRMDVEGPSSLTFWRFMSDRDLIGDSPSAEWERKWAVILKGIAIMTETSSPSKCAHDPNVSVGRALRGDGHGPHYSQSRLMRLMRLMRMREGRLYSEIISVCRTLHSAGASLDWGELALFIICDDLNEDVVKAMRTNIMRDFFMSARDGEQR